MGIKDLAAKARRKMRGDDSAIDDNVERMADKFDNATGNRFSPQTDRVQEAMNERVDDFTGHEPGMQNRDPREPRGR